jgi:hypothetical protein
LSNSCRPQDHFPTASKCTGWKHIDCWATIIPFCSNHIFPTRVLRFSTTMICVASGIAGVTKIFPSYHFSTFSARCYPRRHLEANNYMLNTK